MSVFKVVPLLLLGCFTMAHKKGSSSDAPGNINLYFTPVKYKPLNVQWDGPKRKFSPLALYTHEAKQHSQSIANNMYGHIYTQKLQNAKNEKVHHSEELDMEFHTYFNQHQHLVNVEETSNND